MTIKQEKLTLHVMRKGEIRSAAPSSWNDPHKLAGFAQQKRAALLNNPMSRSDDDPVQILGLQGDAVIGKIDLIAGELLVRGEPVPVLWTSAYFVPEEFRHTMVGIMIVLKMQQLHHTIAACGVSQMALPIFQKLKWLDFTQPRFMLIRRSRSIVEKYLGTGIGGAVATKVADGGLLLHRGALRAWSAIATRSLRTEMGPAPVLPGLSSPAVIVHRSREWLDWLLAESFESDPTRRKGLYVVRDKADNVLGYFLLKMRVFETASHRGFKNVLMGSLYDWMTFDSGQLTNRQIALLATRELANWGADAIEICTDNPDVGRAVRRLGFLRVGELHTLVRAAKPSPLAGQFPDQKDWRLRPADGDNFFM